MKKIVLALSFIFGLFLLAGFLLPKESVVVRSADIAAPADLIFSMIGDLRQWPEWTIWAERDPTMQKSFSEISNQIGSHYEWKSKSQGSGRIVLTHYDSPRQLGYEIEFYDFHSKGTGFMTLEVIDTGTKITWTTKADLGNNPVLRYLGIIMDKWIGDDLEKSLNKLNLVFQ